MVKIQVNSQGKAYIANGKALEAKRIAPVIEPLSVTPTTSAQTITAPSGVDGYSPVNVAAVTAAIDSDIKASNIKSGISILGVTGTVTELNGETRTETLTSSAGNTFTPSSGKNAVTSITVTPNNQNRSVTPSTSSQTLNVNSGYSGNGTISVSAVTSSIDANIQAGNIKKGVQILGVTGTYGGSSGKYKLLDRVKAVGDGEIGTVSGFFTDANNVEYAVVCLDAKYRKKGCTWCSNTTTQVTNLPLYTNQTLYSSTDTATFNTQKIYDFCRANNYTSDICDHCHNLDFSIDYVLYTAEVPNVIELIDIFRNRIQINSLDITADDYQSLIIPSSYGVWSSNQISASDAFYFRNNGYIAGQTKTGKMLVIPVLEIPNQ